MPHSVPRPSAPAPQPSIPTTPPAATTTPTTPPAATPQSGTPTAAASPVVAPHAPAPEPPTSGSATVGFFLLPTLFLAIAAGLTYMVASRTWQPEAVAITLAIFALIAGGVELAGKITGMHGRWKRAADLIVSVVKPYSLAGAVVAAVATGFLR